MYNTTTNEWLSSDGGRVDSTIQYNPTDHSDIYSSTSTYDDLLYRQVLRPRHVSFLPTPLAETTSVISSFNTSDTDGLGGTNSTGNTTTYNQSTILDYAENIGDILVFYYTPTIVFVGIIGNILSVLVFFRTKLKKLSSSYYLAALGISDTAFLILVFMNWLNFADLNLINRDFICQLYSFLQGVCSFLSVWYVVAFTVERFIAVLYPLKRQSMCTVRRAVIVLSCLTLSGCIFSVPLIYFFSPVYHDGNNTTYCDVVEEYKVSGAINFSL